MEPAASMYGFTEHGCLKREVSRQKISKRVKSESPVMEKPNGRRNRISYYAKAMA